MATRYLVRIPFKSIFHSQRITLNKIYANIKYLSENCNYTEVEIFLNILYVSLLLNLYVSMERHTKHFIFVACEGEIIEI